MKQGVFCTQLGENASIIYQLVFSGKSSIDLWLCVDQTMKFLIFSIEFHRKDERIPAVMKLGRS